MKKQFSKKYFSFIISLMMFSGSIYAQWTTPGPNTNFIYTGNVGIGNTTPSYKLDILGNQRISGTPLSYPGTLGALTSGGYFSLKNNSNNYFMVADGSKLQAELGSTTTSATYASSLMLNPYGGNVGIGTTTPTSKLNVNGQITIDQKNFGGYGGLLIKGGNPSSNYPNIAFSVKNNAATPADVTTALINGVITNNAAGSESMDLGFYTSKTGLSGIQGTPKMYIKDDGNVGVGTSTPQQRLSVNGGMNIDQANTNVGSVANALTFGYTSGEGIGSKRTSGGNQYGLDFYTLFANRMSITNAGNVGIGTTAPAYKLDVCGTIRAKEVRVETGWCDYVFANDYKLRPLSEVENFIKTNKHLPDVTAGPEIETNGLEVGKVSAQMIKKIEELTLYIIDQQKEINLLKDKVTVLASQSSHQ